MFAPRRSSLFSLLLLQALGWIGVCPPAMARGADPEQIVVRLSSGRTFTAAVDMRTDSSRLWLRFDRSGVSVLRPVGWQSVETAWRNGRVLNAAELQEAIDELKSARLPREPVAEPTAETKATEEECWERESPREPLAAKDHKPADVVRSIAIDASLAHWSGGVESDGILLRVSPLDADGNLIAASGTLEVDLFGDQYGSPTRGRDYRVLGHWASRLEADQVTLEGAAVRLPFQAVSPDFANDLSPYAVVHVRFSAPGHGTFEASTNPVRLRPYNGVRDRLQQAAGTRFFPNERTNRNQSRQAEPR
jgi:hypothetical protein